MKKFVVTCLAALAVVAMAEQKASAWCDFNFGVGMNVGFKCGGCKLLCGLIQTQPAPMPGTCCDPCCIDPCCPPPCCPPPCAPHMGYAAAPDYAPAYGAQQPTHQHAGYQFYGQGQNSVVPAYWYER